MLLEAFVEEFTGLDEVCLAIRSTGLKDENIANIHNPYHARIIKLDRIPAQGIANSSKTIVWHAIPANLWALGAN